MELSRIKELLGIDLGDASKDVSLEFIMENVQEIILNYCNIDVLPEGLVNTAYRMAIDLYRNENIGSEESPAGSVSSISEGDVSTSFNQIVDSNFSDTILKSYTRTLKRYRKLVF